MAAELTEPTVAAFVAAINAGDRDRFFGLLTEDATMADDGSERDLAAWVDREIFSAAGRMEVRDVEQGGRSFTADFTNSAWGTMRTRWTCAITEDGRVSRFETGQA
jgi:hypothetical protein